MARTNSAARVDTELVVLRHRMRHSAAHVMADAVMLLFPEAQVGIGPSTDEGFYYDFQVSRPFTPEDLDAIQAKMAETISQDHAFKKDIVSRDQADAMFQDQQFKLEIIQDIPPDEELSTYTHGQFIDLCQGPHVESTGKIAAVKLLNVAGAYWRGDEKRPMLQRIYGTAFESQDALDEYLHMLEEAEKRDHRRLGKQLDLFSIHEEVGPGLIIWHPKGSRIRTIIQNYWQELHESHSYDVVYSPHVGKSRLWEVSGHLDFYQDSMFSPNDVDGHEYYLKPMNCPFHIMIYKAALRSYRELPIRYAELGTVYRYERSGVLHGLMRVRGFTQDDAHIFCLPEQVEEEVLGVLDLTFELLSAFGFSEYSISLSTRPSKYVGDVEMWQHATDSLAHALDSRNLEYDIDDGGGAFYGPKIDIKIKDALGREWQCTTVQFDFNLPDRFDLTFQGSDGAQHRPYMVHRAIMGSVERFIGTLVEHYGGAFPLWITSVQALVIPIADRHMDYANKINELLRSRGIRGEVDSRGERMNLKIREAQLQKIPYMLVVGDSEIGDDTVSVRLRTGENLGVLTTDELVERMMDEVARRA